MSKFREQLEKDLADVFHNTSEFAEVHILDDVEIVCIVTDDAVKQSNGEHSAYTLVNAEKKTLYVADSSLLSVPVVESTVELDGFYYTVKGVIRECGETIITLERNT